MSYEPKIIAFCCNWCSYAAADLAGTARMQYPHERADHPVMCSGMVHPEFITNALDPRGPTASWSLADTSVNVITWMVIIKR
jgi:F420-non-reducing hydrogenase iron-sulfur subunit